MSFFSAVVLGKDVIGFEAGRVEGGEGIILWYLDGQTTRKHIIGYTNDLHNARPWVNRVNSLYAHNTRSLTDPGFVVPSKYARYPVVHDTLETQEVRVMPGDYLHSHLGETPPRPYKPLWQVEYVRLVVHLFKEYTGFTGSIRGASPDEWLQAPQHRYPYLVSRINYSRDTFHSRITLPLELIFLAGERREEIDIIPLAKAEDVAILYNPNPPNTSALRQLAAFGFTTMEDFLGAFRNATANSAHFALCSMTSTAADYLLDDAVASGQIGVGQKTSMPTIDSLAHWLWRFFDSGILVLDAGVASQVATRLNQEYRGNWRICHVGYPRPVPVGIAYRKDDPEWGKLCHEALMQCMQSSRSDVKESLAEAEAYANQNHVRLLTPLAP